MRALPAMGASSEPARRRRGERPQDREAMAAASIAAPREFTVGQNNFPVRARRIGPPRRRSANRMRASMPAGHSSRQRSLHELRETMMRFASKTVLITGGGTGIGAALARRAAREGANVVLVGRRLDKLREVAEETGGLAVAADAANAAEIGGAVAAAKARFGSIDVLIANAGGHGVGPTITMSDETWSTATKLNLDTAFML